MMKRNEKRLIGRLIVWLFILVLALAVLNRGCALINRVVSVADDLVQEVR